MGTVCGADGIWEERENNLLTLVETFSLKCMQLQQAIRSGDDALVRLLDREIEPLIAAILAHKAENAFEIHVQLQFVNNLIMEDGDDRSCVLRHAAAMAVLLDRYFASMGDFTDIIDERPEKRGVDAVRMPADDNLLNEAILDSIPDRIAVITCDYRYLYSNPVNSTHLGRSAMDLVGRHIIEFIGRQRFEDRVKGKLDSCFSGQILDYVYDRQRPHGSIATMRCRMTPLRSANGKVLGATILLQEIGARAQVLAA